MTNPTQPPACIVQDATGHHFQWLPTQVAEYADNSGVVHTSRLGGWYTLDCHPIPPEQVTHPVSIVWGQPEQIGEAA